MNLPFFYEEDIKATDGIITLNEDSSRHIVHVLRMKTGELVRITDGFGNAYHAEIKKEHKKATEISILSTSFTPRSNSTTTIAVSLIKNTSRFEWFLEKATELGIQGIIPAICARTEKQQFRHDRMKNILVSAMLQSQQVWLPTLSEPQLFQRLLNEHHAEQKYIAHCMEGSKKQLAKEMKEGASCIILIGPEGDFTTGEVEKAIENGFLPVSLGNTRLRTETAAVAAAVLMKLNCLP